MAGSADFEELGDLVPDRSRTPNGRTRLGGASALVAAVALIALPGENPAVAVLGALVVLAAWYLLAPTYAFALGHVALAAVLPEEAFTQGTYLVWVAAVEVGLLGILLASVTSYSPEGFGGSETSDGPGIRDGPDARDDSEDLADSEGVADSASRAVVGVSLVLGWVVVGGGLAWTSARSSLGLPAAGGLLVVSAALAAYGLHRYQLVSLGLVGDRDEGEYDESRDEEEGTDEERDDDERNTEAIGDDDE